MGRHFTVGENQGNLNRLEKSGKITKNTRKVGNFRQMLSIILVIFKLPVYYLISWIEFSVKTTKHLKKTGIMEKEKPGNSVSPESGNHDNTLCIKLEKKTFLPGS